jgi:ribosomal protein S27AE
VNLIEKEKIRYWRGEGLGYKALAAKTGLTEAAVKGFCRREGLSGEPVPDTVCRQCAKPLEGASPITPAPRKKFCGDACRMAWWSAHPYLRDSRPANRRACAHCGAEFFSAPGKNRKYCGHPCYVAARFGGNAQ